MGRAPLRKIIVNSEYLSFIRSPYWEIKVRNGCTKAEMRSSNNQLICTIAFSHAGDYGMWFNLFGRNTEYNGTFITIEQAMYIAPKFIFEEINRVFKIL